MLNTHLSQQLIDTIFTKRMSIDNLVAFLKKHSVIVDFLNDNYFTFHLILVNSPKNSIIRDYKGSGFGLINPVHLPENCEKIEIQIPCVHYLLLQYKDKYEQLMDFFTIRPFQVSYLYKQNKKFLLLGFNLYHFLKKNIDINHYLFPLLISSKEELINFHYQYSLQGEKNIDYANIFNFCEFVLTVEDFNFKKTDEVFENRNLTIYLENNIVTAQYKNLYELSFSEKNILDKLITDKLEKNQIDNNFDESTFFEFLIVNNYFINQSQHYNLLLQLYQNTPGLFTAELMALISVKNAVLYNLLKQYNMQQLPEQNSELSLCSDKKNLPDSLASYFNDCKLLSTQLLNTDEAVKLAFDNIQLHIDNILNNAIDYLIENIEERITFESILSKYIVSILNNYLSIPSHLRYKEDLSFLNMTLKQLHHIEKELEKIELSVMSEDLRKIKIYGKFLDTRLSNNTQDIINLE